MEQVQRLCDKMVGRGANRRACGESTPNNESTTYSFAGTTWEVDLCQDHRNELFAALEPYLGISHKVVPVRNRSPYGGNSRKPVVAGSRTFTARDVRAWLRAQGREVPDSGRIAEADIQEFVQAQAS